MTADIGIPRMGEATSLDAGHGHGLFPERSNHHSAAGAHEGAMISKDSPGYAANGAAQKGPKACTTCAKAKARCIPGEEGSDKCERCQRLNKDCLSRPPAPPRVKKQAKRSRVAELEKRLNELSSQFDGSHANGGVDKRSPTASSSNANVNGNATAANNGNQQPSTASKRRKSDILNFEHIFPPATGRSDGDSEVSDWSAEALRPWESPWPLAAEAGVLLKQYRETYAPLFPFIVIPKNKTATELQAERPFLWKAIMMTSCFLDAARQVKLGSELLAEVGKATMVDGVKTLDLLQGTLMLIAWFNFALKSTQLTNLLFLARSMCVNLRSAGLAPDESKNKYEPLEDMRAYAGTYYINTLVFTTNKKIDIFMNTSHLDMCLRSLEAANEQASDEFLVKLVKIQQLAQSISVTMAFDPSQPAMQIPLTMVVQSFQGQLDAFRESLPAHLKEHPALLSHIYIAEVLLMDVALSDQHCSSAIMPVTDRLQLLWACVRSLRAFLNTRFVPRDLERPRFLYLTASDFAYTIITGIKLLGLRLPGWNPEQIKSELALGEMITRQVDELKTLMVRRKSGLYSSSEGNTIRDPLEGLVQLLGQGNFVVDLVYRQASLRAEGNDAEMEHAGSAFASAFDDELWLDLVNDTVWNVNGDPMLMEPF